MSDIVAVEFSPAHTDNLTDYCKSLIGVLGEVKKSRLPSTEKKKSPLGRILSQPNKKEAIGVYYPLTIPACYYRPFPPEGDKEKQMIRGYPFHLSDLVISKAKPVSLYPMKAIPHINGVEKLSEEVAGQEFAYKISGTKNFFSLLDKLRTTYTYCWNWKSEDVPDPSKILMFYEARIYGLHTVLPVYTKKQNEGIVLEVLYREQGKSYLYSNAHVYAKTRALIEELEGQPTGIAHDKNYSFSGLYRSYLKPPSEFVKAIQEREKKRKIAGAEKVVDQSTQQPLAFVGGVYKHNTSGYFTYTTTTNTVGVQYSGSNVRKAR